MKLFALKDAVDPDKATLAVLSCYGKGRREYYLDMPAETDPWTVPLILSSFAKRGQWTVDPAWSRRWVESRIVPPSRQNIGEVLKANGLREYDELALLQLTEGRNSQDDCYLEPLTEAKAPAWYAERARHRVAEVVPLENTQLLVCFRAGDSRLYTAKELRALNAGIDRALAQSDAFNRAAVSPGGRGVQWGANLRITDAALASAGSALPLAWADFARIAPALLVNASEAASMLGCTRQNIHALMKRGSLPAVKTSDKATLFLRADVADLAD